MRIFFVIHGSIQGVGYRNLVKNVADKNRVKGMVRNVNDGSVEVLAEADEETLRKFGEMIKVSVSNGPQVMYIDMYRENEPMFPEHMEKYHGFIIEKTRKVD